MQDGSILCDSNTEVTISVPPRDLSPDCPVRDILGRVGDKWTKLVVSNLGAGPLRFSELKRRIGGISQRMLTETVRTLERDGILLRTVYPTIPPKVEYSLTPMGKTLLIPLQALVAWALENGPQIKQSRLDYDAEQEQPVQPVAPKRETRVL